MLNRRISSIGHLNLIRNAKKHCDYLIVGVNADDLVESYKNKRPIVPLEERAEIVRAIRYVDEAIITRRDDAANAAVMDSFEPFLPPI